jgi:alpha-2-macroglobulin
MKLIRALPFVVLAVLTAAAPALSAQDTPASSLVPDRFLRGYDPITISYSRAAGPQSGGPADGPGEWLRVMPPVAGEYRWLDSRTIQFLPAVPWPALKEFRIQARDRTYTLLTMMVPPSNMNPAPGAAGLEPIGSFTLQFPAVLDAASLARMIRIEVRDLPGLTTDGAWWIAGPDLTVRSLERFSSATGAAYQVTPRTPIPYGKKAILHLRLSLDESVPDSIARYTFSTKPEFAVIGMGAGSVRLPVTSAGATYSVEQAVNCGTENLPLYLEFSEEISQVSLETLKRLVSFEPAVRNLTASPEGRRLALRFQCDREKPYRVTFSHQELTSSTGRSLTRFGRSSFYFFYSQAMPYIVWRAAEGIAERFGPQVLPMEGRGMGRIDLRIYRIDPESLNFWPFPAKAVTLDEASRPPMPGEEPEYGQDMVRQIQLLGSPDISKLFDLPISQQSGKTSFGIDLRQDLAARFGADSPGTYLVGYRSLDATTQRLYARLSITDLCLSTVEEEDAAVFVVTSLRTGAPVNGATVRVDSRDDRGGMKPLITGSTDATGQFRYQHTAALRGMPARIVVRKDADVLVLDPRNPPPAFANNHWSQGNASWLDWVTAQPRVVRHDRRTRAYILSERPVYRPEEPVHILGWVRDRKDGRILKYAGAESFVLTVSAPGGKEWSYPAALNGNGRFYIQFNERDLPTGEYAASLRTKSGSSVLAAVSFRKESYRVPTFMIALSGPDKVPVDKPFEVVLTADYYAGGRVVGEKVEWEVTRNPYSITNPAYPGFLFSTDERFSGGDGLYATAILSQGAVLDEDGSARVRINPAAEGDARARRYSVRATVQGADRQTVTTVKQVYALPPFSVGIRLDRFLTDTMDITPRILVLDHEEKPLAGKQVTVRLLQRQWHSYIAETDFTTGEARYVTDVVDTPVAERTLTSAEEAISPVFPVKEAGVYVVEISSRDFLGRAIGVTSDLFVAGKTAVSWERRKASVFEIAADKASYQPGMSAQLLLKSPYQDGFALVAVEGPQANQYAWVRVANGQGIFKLPITDAMAPGVPVSVLLERGRLEDAGPGPERAPAAETGGRALDLGKPATLGASAWLVVQPVANQVKVALKHEAKRQPGTVLPIHISIADWTGGPLDGEVALWLVDKAVLSLGTEQPLTPLLPFTEKAPSALRMRDSRNLAFGNLPVEEVPGGDGAMDMDLLKDLMERTTVRKNFKTVPYFNPAIPVTGGEADIEVSLPDNLTDFAIRAVAVSGYDKMGVAKSTVSVRLPVVVQSALPRFVRPGDAFIAGGIARVVEGPDGPAAAGISVDGLVLGGADSVKTGRNFVFQGKKAEKLLFPMSAPMALQEKDGASVSVSLFVQRNADKVRDAFKLELPIRADTERRRIVSQAAVDGPVPQVMPEPPEPFRKGTLSRRVVAARDPRLLAIIQGMGYLAGYPHGCLEQRVSRIYPAIALKDLMDGTGISRMYPLPDAAVRETLSYMASCQDEDGLFSFWPGSPGYVSMTAYVTEFLLTCRSAGIACDPKLLDRAVAGLTRSLRSDSRRLLSGWSSYERVEALAALDAAGVFDEGYAQDLAAGAAGLPLYSQARLYIVLHRRNLAGSSRAKELARRITAGVVTRKEGEREIFAGIQGESWGGLVLSSEIKTVAILMDALALMDARSPKLPILADYLVSRSGRDGWGSTADNIAGMRAMKLLLTRQAPASGDVVLVLTTAQGTRTLSTGGKGLAMFTLDDPGPVRVSVRSGASKVNPVHLLLSVDYVPSARGSQLKADNAGFAAERELILVGADGSPADRMRAQAGNAVQLPMDTVVEEHARVINFEDRSFVAVTVPLSAGLEPLNPNLAGAPKEAAPAGRLTLAPTYALYGDDAVTFYYNILPKGTYDFFFRARASFSGSFSEPPARAQLMYNLEVSGRSDGCELRINPASGS